MRSAIAAPSASGSPSARRAFQACTSAVDDLGVEHRRAGRRLVVVHRARPAGRVRLRARRRVSGRPLDEHGRRDQRLGDQPRAVRRCAPGRVWPACAATLWVSSIIALTSASAPPWPGRYWPRCSSHRRIEPLLHPVGVGEIARVVVTNRGSRCCCDDEQPRQEGRGQRTRAASKRRHEEPPGARRGRDGDPRAERGRQRVLPAASGARLQVAGLPGSSAIQCRHQQHG